MSDTRDLIPVSAETSAISRPLFSRLFWLFYLAGSVLGTAYFRCFGFSFPDGLLSGGTFSVQGFFSAFAGISFPFFACLFLSTSLIGYYVLPLVFVSRGFAVSLCAASLLESPAPKPDVMAKFAFPAFFALCGLFAIGPSVFTAACSLRRGGRPDGDTAYPGRYYTGFLFTLAAALCRCVILSDFQFFR